MNRCLFTGLQLGSETKREHTIPRGLGGRFRSREVSCNEFNSRCGSKVDSTLIATYRPIYNFLSPLLSSEHESGRLDVKVEGQPGRFSLEPGAVGSKRGVEVRKDLQTGKPCLLTAEDDETLDRFARKHDFKISHVYYTPAIEESAVSLRTQLLGAEIEIAALKCALLTFDHLLCGRADRFTRSSCIKPVVSTLHDYIMHDADAKVLLTETVWGIDYVVAALAEQLRHEYLPQFDSPFQHVLIATGNAAERTLDLIWSVLGFEAFRFRLSDHWSGGGADFTYLVTCGILKNDTPSPLVELPFPFCMGKRSVYCACPYESLPQQEMQKRYAAMARQHLLAFGDAVELVENKSDEMVRRGIHSMTSCYVASRHTPGLVAEGMKLRLRKMFVNCFDADASEAEFEAIMAEGLQSISSSVRSERIAREDTESENVSWHIWIELDRRLLGRLKNEYGPPRPAVVTDMEVEVVG